MKYRLPIRALLISLVAILSAAAAGETLVVGAGHFYSIQAAIEAADAGDKIQVQEGTYTGNLILNKRLFLEGVNRPVLRGEGTGSVITIVADGCAVRGFIFEHSGSDLSREDSGILLKSSRNVIEDNELPTFFTASISIVPAAIYCAGITFAAGRNWTSVSRAPGLHRWNSPDNIIEDNSIIEERDGIYIQNSHGNQIRRNRATNLRYGLHYMSSDRNVFEDNILEQHRRRRDHVFQQDRTAPQRLYSQSRFQQLRHSLSGMQ